MRLLVCISSLGPGGAEGVVAGLVDAWDAAGHEVTLLTLAGRAADFYVVSPTVGRESLELTGSTSSPLAATSGNCARVRAIRRVIRDRRPEVIVSFTTNMNVLAILAARGTGCRVLVSERTHPAAQPLERSWRWLRRISYRYADAVVALTTDSARWIARNTSARRVVVIPNTVDERIRRSVRHVCPSESIYGRDLVLAVGRLGREKGFDLLINAFSRVRKEFPTLVLAILGDGDERPRLEQLVGELGLRHHVVMPGTVANVADWYARAKLFVLSSHYEGFPNALAEALAHGVPAIAFDCATGPRDIVRHGVDGLLVRSGDVDALTGGMRRLLRDDSLRAQMSIRAREIRERYSSAKILAMWQQVLGQGHASELSS